MPAPLTRRYAAFAAGMTRRALSATALDVVRLGFTDCAGVILAGRNEPAVRGLVDFARSEGAAGRARFMFGAMRGSARAAGLVNATAAHALDYDDFAFSNHPSAVLCPTILAAAEDCGADGARMARAYVAGYEIWGDIMKREPDHLYDKGWHPTAVFGPLGAAAAASVVYGLDETQTMHALALAASMAGGVFENFGTMAKPFHGGRAAETGLTAAAFAARGLEASPSAIEGKHGLLRGLTPAGRVDVETPPTLGAWWRIEHERLNIKKYPTVGASQRGIDAMLSLAAATPIDPERVVKITPLVSEKHLAVMPFHRPKTALEAKFSIEFAMACALIHGAVGLRELHDDIVTDPRMQALMGKVEPKTTKDFAPDWPNAAPFDQVTVELDNGQVLVSPEIRRATGHGDTPLSRPSLKAKFDSCAAHGGVSSLTADIVFDAMQNIDRLSNTSDIPTVAA
jgi:2-methylcitrate dehydratase PrpD